MFRIIALLAALIGVPFLVPSLAPHGAAQAGPAPGFAFDDIDGGTHRLQAWHGRPVLVVNTASRCAFTRQYDGLQALYDRYRDVGLVVLAVPSNDFRQELSSGAEVKAFCALNFDLDLPMTDITRVRGAKAHPFYAWMAAAHGFVPAWNFNKVLLDRAGRPVVTFGARTAPLSQQMIDAVERALR